MKIAACTPTRNRRWTWNFSKACMETQLIKPDIWIILDNSSDPNQDWSISVKDNPSVIYEREQIPRTIGWMRNRCLEIALENHVDYIVFWDDDDYYPPTRISSAVNALEANPEADIAGSSLMYLLLTRENVLMTTGPFNDNHCTGATMTVRSRYAKEHRFDETREKAEEITFTKNWSAKVVQIPAEQVIVVMGHSKNTVDKSDLLKTPTRYIATIVNDINGKMVFRTRWPVPWDLWKSTFFGEAYAPPPPCILLEECQTVTVPTLHTEENASSDEHRA